MPYGPDTTAEEVLAEVDLTGRRIAITGASSGLGEESSRTLAARGAAVTMLARNRVKSETAAARIRAQVPDAQLELGEIDLASLTSIRAFATHYLDDHDAIDVLINNAGVMACPLFRTIDGFEMQFGTNHLGHFLLTALLARAILNGDAPRIVTVSSSGHAISDVDLDDPNFERQAYDPWLAYGRSKTANALFAKELARRLGGRGVLAFAAHPGTVATDLDRHLGEGVLLKRLQRIKERAEAAGEPTEGTQLKTVEAGAATLVWAATAPELADHNGAYVGDCRLGEAGAPIGSYGVMSYLEDPDHAARLWTLSEELVEERFEI